MENEILPINPSVQPVTPAPTSSSTNWPKVLLLILLELIIIAGSIFIGFQIGKRQAAMIEQPVVVPPQTVASPSVLPTKPNPDDSWKVYTNTVHKYSVKYPADWTVNSSSADKIETYESSVCCNTAFLTISNGLVTWKLSINQPYGGFQAPSECQPGPNQCSTVDKPMTVLGNQVNRTIYRLNSSNKIIKGEMTTSNSHPGFGQIGFSTPNVEANHIKYFLEYSGSEIDKQIDTLDAISASLEVI